MGKSERPPEQFISIGHAHDPLPFNPRAFEELIAELGDEATARPGTVVSGMVETPVIAPPHGAGRARWLVGGVAAAFLLILVGSLVQHGPADETASARPEAAPGTTLPAHPRLEIALRPQLLPDTVSPRPIKAATTAPPVRLTLPAAAPVKTAANATAATVHEISVPPARAQSAPAQPLPISRVEPSFDCATVRNLAEELVCTDPQLARQDRALASAYRRAVEAGAARSLLRLQQERWTEALDEAAHEDPAAMPRVYAVRIAELNDMAEQGPFGR